MSEEVQFDEDMMSNTRRNQMAQADRNSSEPKMVMWIMDHGFAKTPAMAEGILVGAIIVNVILTYFVIKLFL